MDKKAGIIFEVMPLFLVFIVGTFLILGIGFFLLSWMSQASSVTGYSIVGIECDDGSCGKINAGVLGLIIISLVTLQYFLYKHYHKKRKGIQG